MSYTMKVTHRCDNCGAEVVTNNTDSPEAWRPADGYWAITGSKSGRRDHCGRCSVAATVGRDAALNARKPQP